MMKFTEGLTFDRTFAHRGDVFTTEGVFKDYKDVKEDDHILCKENRPVLVVSDDRYNMQIVRVLPLSSKLGNSSIHSITSSRLIQIPAVYEGQTEPSYIDVSQEFTINVWQLKFKLCHLDQKIVDTAVAFNLFQKMNANSVGRIMNLMSLQFPEVTEYTRVHSIPAPNTEQFQTVKRGENVSTTTKTEEVNSEEKTKSIESTTTTRKRFEYPPVNSVDDAYALFVEWNEGTTDSFCYKYGMNKSQYQYLKQKCVKILLKEKPGFTKFDWRG